MNLVDLVTLGFFGTRTEGTSGVDKFLDILQALNHQFFALGDLILVFPNRRQDSCLFGIQRRAFFKVEEFG